MTTEQRIARLELRIQHADTERQTIIDRLQAHELRVSAEAIRSDVLQQNLMAAQKHIASLQSWIHDFCQLSDKSSVQAQLPCPDEDDE